MLVPAGAAEIARGADVLRAGGLVAFPTETVYGLGANAFDARAVARIFEAKHRPAFDPLIVHVLDDAMLATVASDVPPAARMLIERFWPGPLTLVLRRLASVPPIVSAGLDTVAVRSPSHPVARALLAAADLPIAAPSANIFGGLSPTRAEHVEAQLGRRIDLVLDAGPTEHGIESTILLVELGGCTLLRHGALPIETLEPFTGPLSDATAAFDDPSVMPLAPGALASHYAPKTPLRVVEPAAVAAAERAGAALLAYRTRADGSIDGAEGYAAVRVLSPQGDLREAASNLFDRLHELDGLGLRRIDAAPVPEAGLGRAIADRLRRASTR